MRPSRELAAAAAVAVATLIAAVVVPIRLLAPVSPIDTDIMALVPQDHRDPVLAAAIERSASLVASRVALLLRHDDDAALAGAATDLRSVLEQTGLFVPVEGEAAALWRWLFEHRDRLLCPADRALLERGEGTVLAAEAMARIQAPLVPVRGDLLHADPLLLTARLVDCFAPAGGWRGQEALVVGRLAASPFVLDVQDRIGTALTVWQQRHGGIELARAGAVFHAAAGAARARVEIARVSTISTVIVLLLFLALFASVRAAALALGAMALAVLGGLAACLAVFAKVHALALLFGAAMTGIAVDYAIHVMVAGLAPGRPEQEWRNPALTIARPLWVSLLTTLAGFVCLLASGIELMQQIAVFAGAGLLLSFGFSRFVLGYCHRRPARIPRPASALAAAGRSLLGWSVGPAVLVPVLLVLSAMVWLGLQHLRVTDDVRTFQAPPADLAAEEREVAAATAQRIDLRFVLVQAPDLATLRSREAAAAAGLERPLPSPAWLDPPEAREAEDRDLIAQRLLAEHSAPLARLLGIDPESAYGEPPPGSAPTSLPAPIAGMRGLAGGMHFSIIPLAPEDARAYQPSLDGSAELVDPASVYGQLLERFRRHATWSLVAALIACGLGLAAVCRRLASLRLLLPGALAIAIVPALAGLAGLSLSVFSIMGLFVALGLGVDYAAFLATDGQDEAPLGCLREAGIVVAAMTTVVPMAILGLSGTLPVAHFGFAVAVGTTLCLILSPLARGPADPTSGAP